MRAVYVIGPSGSGKSTFVSNVLSESGISLGPNRLIHTYTGSRLGKPVPVTMTGHAMRFGDRYIGEYLGVMRESFPGTDGLTANCGMVATDWALRSSVGSVIAEGAKLGTRRFLAALSVSFDLMVVSLDAPDEELLRRRAERESKTTEANALRTAVRSRRLTEELKERGYYVLDVDSSNVNSWTGAIKKASLWITHSKGAIAQ